MGAPIVISERREQTYSFCKTFNAWRIFDGFYKSHRNKLDSSSDGSYTGEEFDEPFSVLPASDSKTSDARRTRVRAPKPAEAL